MTQTRSVAWRRLDAPGLEHATLEFLGDEVGMRGTVITVHEGQPLTIQYIVDLDIEWRTKTATAFAILNELRGWRSVHVSTRLNGRWTETTAGERLPIFGWNGCYDVDFGFSPITNVIPIRRLDLSVGQSADVDAGWITFPGFETVRLRQRYSRLARDRYLYEAPEHSFTAELTVDELGLVIRYGDLWERVAAGDGFDPVAQAPADLGDLLE
jgi:hypothetical protein